MTPELGRAGRRRVLLVLCLTEITSWGVLYYAFPVLAPSISGDTGWPVSAVTAAFSAGLVVSALVGVPVGRILDRHGPRWLMTGASVLGVPAVAAVATAGSFWLFTAAWLVVGVAQAGTLYPPAFAALTRWWGDDRVRALTSLTLVGGLASTVFAPLTAALLTTFGWRGTYLVLAAVLLAVTVPAHLFGLRGAWPDALPADRVTGDASGPAAIARSRPFLLLTGAICLGAFTSFAVTVNQVPLLLERGLSTGLAAWALGLGGLGQVTGRLFYPRLVARTGVRGRAALVLGALGVATGLLAVLPGPAWLLVLAAVGAGLARGIFTLLQATALSDRWSPEVYGRLNGILQAPATIAIALGPAAGSGLAALFGGYPEVFALLAGVAMVAAVLTVGTRPILTRTGTSS
ncbi:MFS transporter [Pseudonocardia endophytica]|uniref:Putative MFS family arabinose efflux permease n=1 Tax=Pseudonocardia endophytica TaxID=401976 RepID=A0A4R1HVG7_PSEEN|nr:MFS transporter [Pseudonocardia endophytica]TCK24985.1 putative MFS family arabinose efflux permease [Pseudonocardia endophytica]